ncbi:hypothetical protein C0993_001808, partial [Termitomyces sp. T159_Od127]
MSSDNSSGDEKMHTKVDIREELRPISGAPGLAYHDSSAADPNVSLAICFRTLSFQVSEHQHPGKPQDDVVNFFEQLTYHNVSVEKLCGMFGTTADRGLDNVVVARNLQRDGKNTIAKKKPKYLLKVISYLFTGFCSILWVAVIIFFICWRPLGNPKPQANNLALAILIIFVILCQAVFSA